ncbi:uncharacterized protein BJ171DRAFT_472247 [Polychytrium aggregatum]|uniref:uncharacterized protein n=1 Tax=Polychytrium aggregatum TaxID=110093 RepID=UPI0022FF372B|nr:uncharacterized protein BJ171DRAFT_472247 [Polychytrium aggregatum]KAI9207958.1 hypothetical protein BJ171DRAFT_472247 [Polychytrium aggregatum]
MSRILTAGEECQLAAKTFSAFAESTQGGAIPANFIAGAMGIAVIRGETGVAVVRLKSGEWSAPCGILLENANGQIQPGQETILLFTSESAILSLVARTRLVLNHTHRFLPGPFTNQFLDPTIDVYVYVRFSGIFTPSDLVQSYMTGWGVREDMDRHGRWHGKDVSWHDVLTNKITVDRSSVGNALYVILNLAAGKASMNSNQGRKNYADLDKLPNGPVRITNAVLDGSSSGSTAIGLAQQQQQPTQHLMGYQQTQAQQPTQGYSAAQLFAMNVGGNSSIQQQAALQQIQAQQQQQLQAAQQTWTGY